MNQINSIRNTVSYYDAKNQSAQEKSNLNSIPAASIYQQSGLNALSSYNQASVSFEGLGFLKKLTDKIKTKKEEAVAKHQQKKEEKLQKKEEKLQKREEQLKLVQQREQEEQKAMQASHTGAPDKQEIIPDPKPEEIQADKIAERKMPITEAAGTETQISKSDADVEAAAKDKKKTTDIMDMGFFEDSHKMKYLRMVDRETGTITIDWYDEDGNIRAIQETKTDGTDTYTTFYDKEAKQIKEDFITLPDGKHRYIKYLKDGKISVAAELKEDNKTLISYSKYHYKKDSDKLDYISTRFEGKLSTIQWYRDDETLDCQQFMKNGRLTQTDWYFEDGETVRTAHFVLENGGLQREVYDKEGRILLSDITKPDKQTTEEITNYYYKDNSKNYYRTKTSYEDSESIDTWYNENEVATCSIFSENDRKTKAIWYFEDGETPNVEELYLKDGRTQKVTMDKNGRWLTFTEYSGDTFKTTTYLYTDESKDVPHSSITTYSDGKKETVWYDDKENMTCRKTEKNNTVKKIEWFHADGETPRIVQTYTPGNGVIKESFDEKGNPVKDNETISA